MKIPFEEMNEFYQSLNSIENFYDQIKSTSEIVEKAKAIQQILQFHFYQLRKGVIVVLQQLEKRKEDLLKHYEGALLPAAKEVLKDLEQETIQLKIDLEHSLTTYLTTCPDDWIEQAKQWAQIFAKWQDLKNMDQKILKMAAEKSQALIERDIKVIHDYQGQSLSHLTTESQELKDLETRLKEATDEPLKEIAELKNGPRDSTIKHVTDWIERLHTKRETYFDKVLMKIDSILKDVVTKEEREIESQPELEGEILFMERELHHLNEQILRLDLNDEKEVNLLEIRLEGIKEHLDNLEVGQISKEQKSKIDKLYNMIATIGFRLKEKD